MAKKSSRKRYDDDLEKASKDFDAEDRPKKLHKSKKIAIILILSLVIAAAAIGCLVLLNHKSNDGSISDAAPEENEPAPTYFYSSLTGEVIAQSGTQYNADGTPQTDMNGRKVKLTVAEAEAKAAELNKKRVFCVQIPNGLDGARPQVGLDQAQIVYEAIAEAGITRFAAIFQDPTDAAIGPIRSLRNYYLDWDVPYDCTIVHAGGEDEALERVQSYTHLSESLDYMWRADYNYSTGRGYLAPNNLFTSGKLLKQYAADAGQTESTPKTFPRLTPAESKAQRDEAMEPTQSNEQGANTAGQDNIARSIEIPAANKIDIHYSPYGYFNVHYDYDPGTNKYARSYIDGSGKHEYYTCPSDLDQPAPQEQCGELHQVQADVVITMMVSEHLSEVNHYREVITTTGSGKATIFQNGRVFTGTWSRSSIEDQIKFTDESGAVIKLAPGKIWISAVPSYQSVSYE